MMKGLLDFLCSDSPDAKVVGVDRGEGGREGGEEGRERGREGEYRFMIWLLL